ncbi:MAG: hypothetical protein ACKOYM_00100 [Actinomycetes bacterium]
MRPNRQLRRVTTLIATTLIVAGLSGCTPTANAPMVTPDAALWTVGDSLATGTGFAMYDPRPFVWGVGASGFTTRSITTILGNTLAKISATGFTPKTVVVTGGVNDFAVNASVAEIEAGMVEFEAAMNARGAEVVFVKEPAWSREAQFAPIYSWIETRRHWIDCLAVKGPHMYGDGDHPLSYLDFGACVSKTLATLPGLRLT